RRRMRDAGAVAAHCPTSNQFLGSGLFDFAAAKNFGMPVALATDVGGGSSFSMLLTMNEAHKVARLSGHYLTARRMFWQATQGAAKHLGLTGQIGTLEPGAEADFIVLDPRATPLLARRSALADSLEELLFALAMLGDDRAVAATYAAGLEAQRRDAWIAPAVVQNCHNRAHGKIHRHCAPDPAAAADSVLQLRGRRCGCRPASGNLPAQHGFHPRRFPRILRQWPGNGPAGARLLSGDPH